MNFPGTNTITLSKDSLENMLRASLTAMLGDAYITDLTFKNYPTRLEVEFTSEQPEVVPAPEPAVLRPESSLPVVELSPL